jgi:hypothetical protein
MKESLQHMKGYLPSGFVCIHCGAAFVSEDDVCVALLTARLAALQDRITVLEQHMATTESERKRAET